MKNILSICIIALSFMLFTFQQQRPVIGPPCQRMFLISPLDRACI